MVRPTAVRSVSSSGSRTRRRRRPRVVLGAILSNSVSAPTPQTKGSKKYVFGSWSDGGAQTHTVVAPANPTTYTARFK